MYTPPAGDRDRSPDPTRSARPGAGGEAADLRAAGGEVEGARGASPRARTAEVLTIGDELCRGEIVDGNSAWLSERLTRLGLHVRYRSSTIDAPAEMAECLRLAASRAGVIVTSGGLGPTADDLTVDVIAGLLGVAPTVDEPHRARMAERFAARGFAVTPNNLRQVRVPVGADALPNRAGLAPGFHVELPAGAASGPGRGDAAPAHLFAMPGVPREMKRIFDDEIDPRLRALAATSGHAIPAVARRVFRVAAMGESHVDHALRGLVDDVPGATLHFRILYPETLVTVVIRRDHEADAQAALDRVDADLRARLGDNLYATGDATLAQVVGERLRARRETVATAESCTGGLVCDLLTDVPGSSDYVRGGVVAYSNDLKRGLLGVREETLAAHGAVSEPCVREMAEGVRRATSATWGIALSGIAGPGGGSDEKPVGLVHFCVAGPGVVEARRLVWPNERRMVKQLAAQAALFLLHRTLGPA